MFQKSVFFFLFRILAAYMRKYNFLVLFLSNLQFPRMILQKKSTEKSLQTKSQSVRHSYGEKPRKIAKISKMHQKNKVILKQKSPFLPFFWVIFLVDFLENAFQTCLWHNLSTSRLVLPLLTIFRIFACRFAIFLTPKSGQILGNMPNPLSR